MQNNLRSTLFPLACLFLASLLFSADSVAPKKELERNWENYPIREGHFNRSWESLASYEAPEWFRDAKLGFWSIIGPQCVPMQGDWYARNMYIEGSRQNNYHVENYGHPSEFGYKDLIELFNPEDLDYDRLLSLYKKAGAKYAVILAVHHDNFDLWDSKFHKWNSVNMGPKRDLVGEFRDAALKNDLRFGVTTHLGRSYSWLQTSHGADKGGPMAGVPYDGADPKYASLYHTPEEGCNSDYENKGYPRKSPEHWDLSFYNRLKDLLDSYQPDLMYFDGPYPFPNDDGSVGRQLVAHYYNANAEWHDGDNQAAMCVKHTRPETCVLDIERGKTEEIAELPWQTDTCIGYWYYRTGVKYKTAPDIIRMLIDIASKNGNLLLNIPVHPSGTIDSEEEAILLDMAEWMAINGDGLYGTRPWKVFGEGPSMTKEKIANRFGGMKDVEIFEAGDLRFMTKGENRLNVFLMAWPENGIVTIKSLADSDYTIESVAMFGVQDDLVFQKTKNGLVVELPKTRPCNHAWTLSLQGQGF